jgi:hypothetical protein
VRPVVSALTVMGEAAPIENPLVPPLVEMHCARYDVIGLPLAAPGVKLTVVEVSVAATVTLLGASGAAAGVAGAEAGEGGLSPSLLVAVTVQV